MYDASSRLIVTNRVLEDRLAETRRAHLLRENNDDRDAFAEHARVSTEHSLLGRVAAAIRGATHSPVVRRPAYR
jgi:hypothetical protein